MYMHTRRKSGGCRRILPYSSRYAQRRSKLTDKHWELSQRVPRSDFDGRKELSKIDTP